MAAILLANAIYRCPKLGLKVQGHYNGHFGARRPPFTIGGGWLSARRLFCGVWLLDDHLGLILHLDIIRDIETLPAVGEEGSGGCLEEIQGVPLAKAVQKKGRTP